MFLYQWKARNNEITQNKRNGGQEEEALQEKAEYPDRGKHHEKHEEFKKTIQELYEYLHDYEGPTDQFSELVHRNVVDWLFGHIKTFDRSVAEFIFMRENPERC